MQTIAKIRENLEAPRQQEITYTVWLDDHTHRAEADGLSGRELARRLLTEKPGLPCFGRMRYPDFWGATAGDGATEEEAMEQTRAEADRLRQRIEAGVAQLVRCAHCPPSAPCYRVTMTAKACSHN